VLLIFAIAAPPFVIAERESLDNAQRILLRFKSVYVE
jgi:hypothetical protein